MRTRKWSLGAAALGCAVFVTTALTADELRQEVRGRLVAVDTSSGARGDFRIESRRRTGRVEETIMLHASRLGAAVDTVTGNRPEYHAVLIDAAATTTADFGAVRLNRGGRVEFRFKSPHDSFPAGATTVTAFGGGTFELQRDGAAVLRGSIPAFVNIGDQGSDVSRASFHGNSRLSATINGGSARGNVDVHASSDKKRGDQRLRISVQRVGSLGSPFTVVAIDAALVETTLGTITTRGRSGEGSLTFDTHKGDTVPGGGILGLSGQTIEVRNNAGTAVLTGTLPTVP
jgi:hypothetical protein